MQGDAVYQLLLYDTGSGGNSSLSSDWLSGCLLAPPAEAQSPFARLCCFPPRAITTEI